MRKDREPVTGAAFGDGAGAAAWGVVEAGWPRRRWDEADYKRVVELLTIYFNEGLFTRLGPVQRCRIVTAAVTEFMVTWHGQAAARARRGDRRAFPGPAEVREAVTDAMLERAHEAPDAAGVEVGAEAEVESVGPSVHDDASLAGLALHASPDVVRAGLRQLFTEEAVDDFLVITAYLDLADPDLGRPPPTSDVVARLHGQVPEFAARHAIRSFQARLKGIGQRDATA